MIVYVAAPYSNVEDKEQLMTTISKVCGKYMLDHPGEYTITGLVHHYACQHYSDLGTDWKFWKDFCVDFLLRCDKLLVITFDGWMTSGGVQSEIIFAKDNLIPVVYVNPYSYLGGSYNE